SPEHRAAWPCSRPRPSCSASSDCCPTGGDGSCSCAPSPEATPTLRRGTGSMLPSVPPTAHSTSAPSTTGCGDVMATTHVPVVIVGAGPTGASAAIMLAQRGIECLLLDRWQDVYPLPRAVHFDDEVFRIFAQMGIAEQVRAISRPLPGMQLVDGRHRVLAEFARDPSVRAHGYPQANMFHQPQLEQVLRDRLAALPQVH